ncbi:ABC transporter substrate-binding protein [Mesorhizobium sp. CA8]|uniref:ABC transporter substrate-binding protein n=1 Tax=unclassified Mesorhizobium TaxID=325217 RepID=UPI001CC9037C|nr:MULTISPECIES: ABC transporter substrate-binding protein [unclassified Mesorhizobium]MBZ9761654.1 ABC transporter substrate-binding protein [Mesorhizobium sp. CA8]MBZ9820592.1 ABC transporter substrate-binding protein [Mesorhizobium sp. CA4]
MRPYAPLLAFGLAIASTSAHTASVPESNDTINMMIGNWTSFVVQAQIAGQLLQKLGYTIQYVPADDSARYPAFENGDLTIGMETWATTQREAFEKSLATGKILDMGSLSAPAKEEWWYPIYMKEKCPGLPDWKALKDPKCAEAFSTPETAPKGRYLSGPVDWGGFDVERVQALGLPFEVVNAGTEASLFAELQSAYERKAPIMLWVYTPHWVPAKFKGEWVQFPKYEPACYSDPSWGINKDKAYDCGKPEGWIKKMAWAEGEKKWPCAYEFIKSYDMDSKTLSEMAAEVDLDGKKAEDVAAEWIGKNEPTWQKWTSCAK